MTGFVWRFPAIIDEWHDGDTCYVHRGALPGTIIHGEHVRIEGINAPELSHAGGAAARDYAISLAPPSTAVTLICQHEEKYGRLLARVILPDGSSFGDRMIAAGQAVAYPGDAAIAKAAEAAPARDPSGQERGFA